MPASAGAHNNSPSVRTFLKSTVKRAERSAGEPAITLEHLRKIRAALEAAGSQFTHRSRSCRSTASLTLVERGVGDRASGA